MMRHRRFALAIIALALAVLAMRHPSASIEVRAHDSADPDPRRVQAALDLGVMAVSVAITWTARLADAR